MPVIDKEHYKNYRKSLKDREKAVLLRLDQAIESKEAKILKRAVWRVGELEIKKALNDLHGIVGQGDDLLDYCLAWAIGRIGEKSSVTILDKLIESSHAEFVKRMALDASLKCGDLKKQKKIATGIYKTLFESLQQALDKEQGHVVINELEAAFRSGYQGIDQLFSLYLLSHQKPWLRTIIINYLSSIPIKSRYFKAVRQIYKSAEFRMDAEVFGLLAWRIDTSTSMYSRFAWDFEYIRLPDSFEFIQFDQEIAKPDCRITYSGKTRDYFRTRSWRTLKRMGEVAHPAYCEMAAGILLPFTEAQGTQSRRTDIRDWHVDEEGEWHQIVVMSKGYGAFSTYIAFNHIIHEHSEHYLLAPSKRAWLDADSSTVGKAWYEAPRSEAWPGLWDQHPDLLVGLINHSCCELVQRFASRALFDNKEYWPTINFTDLQAWLKKPYSVTAFFAMEILQTRQSNQFDNKNVLALLASGAGAARTLGREWLEEDINLLSQNAELLTAVITSIYEDVRRWGKDHIETLTFNKAISQLIITKLIAFLLRNEVSKPQRETVVRDISWVLSHKFANQVRAIEMKVIEDLLQHPSSAVQAVAGEIILSHGVSAEFLPVKIFRSLMEAKAESVRDIGIKLFSQLPEPVLLNQPEMVVSFCISEHEAIRQAARPMIRVLAPRSEKFAQAILAALIPFLFRKEPIAGFHADVLNIIKIDLSSVISLIDKDTNWRMLYARSRVANEFGAFLISRREANTYSVTQWAVLANHEIMEVRDWAVSAFESNVEHVRQESVLAARILESEWEAVRQFAMKYFLEHFSEREWTPELLIAICDSERQDVQQYAHELMLDFFKEGQGVEYLMKLSQHPSHHVQMFVTGFLDNYASNQPERVEALEYYFRSVLSMVQRGRKVKDRVYHFLQNQAQLSESGARTVINILVPLSITMVRADRDKILELMTGIHKRFPDIEMPLVILDTRHEKSEEIVAEVNHGA